MTILLLEDDYSISSALKEYLELIQEIECSVATNRVEALELFKTNSFDIIFFDFKLADGFDKEFILWVRDTQTYSTIVGFSALTNGRKIAEECNLDYFMPKPFNLENIEEIISKNLCKNGLTNFDNRVTN